VVALQLTQRTGEHLRRFLLLYGILFVYPDLADEILREAIVDHLEFLFHRAGIHCITFLQFRMSARCLQSSVICTDLRDPPPRLSESEENLYEFISQNTETNLEMFRLLEFIGFSYCSTDVMDDFSEHSSEINASM
jgi:hypothetical protein